MPGHKFSTLRSRIKSEFNPGVLEFERLDGILREIDVYAVNVTTLQSEVIIKYFASVKQLFVFLRCFILLAYNRAKLRLYDDELDRLWLDVVDFQNTFMKNPKEPYPLGLVRRIDKFFSDLTLLKQTIGFGLPILKHEATKTKIRRVLGVGKPRTATDAKFDKTITIG